MPHSYTTLISAAQLKKSLGDVFIADCSHDLSDIEAGVREFREGHIPGATHFHLDRDLSSPPSGSNGRHPLPERATLEALFAARGLRADQQVVAYDRAQGPYAARLWWLLRWLGHDRVAVLDGGYQAWLAAGGPIENRIRAPFTPSDFRARAPRVHFVQLSDVVANLESPLKLLVDARSPDRYAGRGETLDPRAGHIPGAVSRYFRDNLQANGSFKPAGALRAEWLRVLGDHNPANVVNQCGSGVTACHNILALEYAGLSGSLLYPGSWSEWCSDPSRPIVEGP